QGDVMNVLRRSPTHARAAALPKVVQATVSARAALRCRGGAGDRCGVRAARAAASPPAGRGGSGPLAESTSTIVGINVGGEKVIRVKRSTLTQMDGSYLQKLFCEGSKEEIDYDEHGNVFLDYNPDVFMPLVDWLRDCRDSTPDFPPRVAAVRGGRRNAWVKMMLCMHFRAGHLRSAGLTPAECRAGGFTLADL
ncbi:MAG: hypothetical protein ACKPKO_26985, partial [Candidatus Fonsibacter sp.]